jgi:hypothetical protein
MTAQKIITILKYIIEKQHDFPPNKRRPLTQACNGFAPKRTALMLIIHDNQANDRQTTSVTMLKHYGFGIPHHSAYKLAQEGYITITRMERETRYPLNIYTPTPKGTELAERIIQSAPDAFREMTAHIPPRASQVA